MRVPRSAIVLAVAAILVAAGPSAAETPAGQDAPAKAAPTASPSEKLKTPAALTGQAPETFRARFETSKGGFVVEVTRAWSPNGADRFYNLVQAGYFDDVRFFRVVPNFVVQFGIHGSPEIARAWQSANIQDDPVKESNKKGFVTYAMRGPNTRTTQLFINLKDNTSLDSQGFSPFGRVVEGMEVVEKLNGEYGETLTSLQGQITSQGNAFLAQKAPRLDFIKSARVAK